LLKLRAGYLQNYSQGLVILNSVAPDPDTNNSAYLLSGVGQSRYRQLEVTARMRLKGEGRQLFFSYVRSRARGDLNDFSNYLGTFPIPIIRGNQFGNLPADLPNRLLAWGNVQKTSFRANCIWRGANVELKTPNPELLELSVLGGAKFVRF
jgi:hypothetical protein